MEYSLSLKLHGRGNASPHDGNASHYHTESFAIVPKSGSALSLKPGALKDLYIVVSVR
jgi:hypothetical protein